MVEAWEQSIHMKGSGAESALRRTVTCMRRTGVVPARLNRDTTGPIARTVTDAALLFQAMVGYDPADNLTSLMLQARRRHLPIVCHAVHHACAWGRRDVRAASLRPQGLGADEPYLQTLPLRHGLNRHLVHELRAMTGLLGCRGGFQRGANKHGTPLRCAPAQTSRSLCVAREWSSKWGAVHHGKVCILLCAQNAIPANYTQFLDAHGLAGARVGVLRQLSNTPTADPELLGIFNAALARMAQQGARAPALSSFMCLHIG